MAYTIPKIIEISEVIKQNSFPLISKKFDDFW